ncbi:MAG TPA: DUF6362 family protein [Acidisoma sp.]|jgi:hypothetical protein|uniref:DUF6362 family protein n=1 Tax=Acidisoma sp. TaxID=1872115 RepID=UPI002BFDC477|nr:DUF6362 family protein [Acidisoma sp.]HTI02639.1 DUF6362 family protein [Acidisoma sp.]
MSNSTHVTRRVARSTKAGKGPDLSPACESVVACLEEAGATLLSLPPSGFSPRLRTATLPVLREAAEAYGWSTAEIRPPMPSAARISRMDHAMSFLGLIPQDRFVLRRIVGCRALVHPVSGRHLFSWRRLGELLGADHKAVQRWHAEGIRLIVSTLRRQAEEAEPSRLPTPPVSSGMQTLQGPEKRGRLTPPRGAGSSH